MSAWSASKETWAKGKRDHVEKCRYNYLCFDFSRRVPLEKDLEKMVNELGKVVWKSSDKKNSHKLTWQWKTDLLKMYLPIETGYSPANAMLVYRSCIRKGQVSQTGDCLKPRLSRICPLPSFPQFHHLLNHVNLNLAAWNLTEQKFCTGERESLAWPKFVRKEPAMYPAVFSKGFPATIPPFFHRSGA